MKYNLMSRDNLIVPNMEDGAEATPAVAPTESTTTTPKTTPSSSSTESEA